MVSKINHWTPSTVIYLKQNCSIHETRIFSSIFGILAWCSIIWFERFGSDLKRMFVNQTISSVCWSMLTWIVFIQIPEMIRYFSKPFSTNCCFAHLLLKNALIVQAFLFFNASNVVRYLFIFRLKDPFNFQDDFWYLFANLWVVTFSLSSQFVYLYLPGCQPLNYFICTGQYQPPCLSTIPPKPNYSTLFLQLLSITSHLFVSIKIRLHKRKQNQSQINIELQNLTDYITSITNLIVMCVATLPSRKSSGLKNRLGDPWKC